MPYIGNTIRAADDYRLIDDISSSFNGSTTSFALQVAGSAPVPFPKSPQQVLISVNGVIQEPDPTGSSGFNLVGTNIVFSSAPTNGHAFFGIIYATADYLNAGGNFPAGSLGAPSITFIGDENSGLYRKGSGSVGFVSDATEIANFDSNGITISSGNIIIPDSIIHNGDSNTKIRFPSADTISAETAGTEALRITSTGRLGINETSPSQKLHVGGDIQVGFATPNDAARQLNFNANRGSAGDTLANINWQWNDKFVAQIRGIAGDDTTNKDDAELGFFTSAANSLVERLRITRTGDIGVGTSDPKTQFHILQSAVTNAPTRSAALYLENNANCELQFVGNSSNDCQLRFGTSNNSFLGAIEYELDNANMEFYTGGSERMRIDSSGNVGIGETSVETLLHIKGTDTAYSGSKASGAIFQAEDAQGRKVQLVAPGAIASAGVGTPTNHTFTIFTGNTERIRVDTSGKVLIGTAAADTGKVVIEGSLTAESDPSNTAGYHLVIRSQTNSNTSKVGIALKNSSDSQSVGAAILHHRTGGGSVGDLAFYTSPSDGTTTERTKITSAGTLLQGSGAIATPKATTGGFDVAANNMSFVFGADSNSGNDTSARTNNTMKDSRIGAIHYTNSEEPVGVVRVLSQSSATDISFGGGSSLFNAATSLRFFTGANSTTQNGTERMRISSTGNVGIGTNNPGQRLEVRQTSASHAIIAVNRPNSDTFCCALGNNSNSDAIVASNNADLIFGRDLSGTFSERFRMKNDGRVSFGNSSPPTGQNGVITFVGFTSRNGRDGNNTANVHNFQWTGTNLNAFVDTTNMGEIRNSASDYRIKRNIQTQSESGIDKIKQLRCVTYSPADYTGEEGTSWSVASDEVKEGFIAHEVAAIIPSGVSGTKDDPNRIQQLNIDAIVSVLTKALQEEIAKREALETRIAALEAT